MSKSDHPSSVGLRNIDLLQGLPPERLDAIARQCAWRNYEPTQHIVSREAQDRDLHLLVAGSVRVTTYSAAGREVSLRDLEAGACFGEVAALDELPRSADVVALSATLVAALPPMAFRALLREEWLVAERVLLRLAGLVRLLTDRILDLSTLSVQSRIHAELLRLARAAGVAANRARIVPAPKHAAIASLVSTYREQVTRELSALTKAGILAKDGGALLVCDVRRLEGLAAAGQL
jgi:CRP-like cAMP-binding protein